MKTWKFAAPATAALLMAGAGAALTQTPPPADNIAPASTLEPRQEMPVAPDVVTTPAQPAAPAMPEPTITEEPAAPAAQDTPTAPPPAPADPTAPAAPAAPVTDTPSAGTPTTAEPAAPVPAQDTTAAPSATQQPTTPTTATPATSTSPSMTAMSQMSESERYRASWVYRNLDNYEVKRLRAQGFDENTIKGAANIAMRAGVDVDYVLRRFRTGGQSLNQVASSLGVSASYLSDEIPGMGSEGVTPLTGGTSSTTSP